MGKTISILIVFNLLVLFCKGQQGNNSRFSYYDSFEKREVIRWTEDSITKNNRQELYLKNIAKLMRLSQINDGKEKLYIRIWIWDEERNYVINIDNNVNKKSCQITEFSGGQDDSCEYIIIFHEWKNLSPKSGWVNFFNILSRYKIPELESGTIQTRVKYSSTGGAYVQFEIAQYNKYRYYEYLEPSYFKNIDKGSYNVYQFLNFFNKEMNVPVYRPLGYSVRPK